MNKEKLDKLKRIAQEAAVNAKRLESIYATQTGPADIRDVVMFSGLPNDIPLRFLIIRSHPDDSDLFLLCPFDDSPPSVFWGITDVVGQDDQLGEVIARTGLTFWCHREDLPINNHEGRPRASEAFVKEIRRVLGLWANGKDTNPTECQLEAQANPDYQEYMDELTACVNTITQRIRS